MLRNHKNFATILFVIVSVLLVAYAFAAYLPHGHECIETDCAICNLIDTYRDILSCTTLWFSVLLLSTFIFVFFATHLPIMSFSEGTPVGLKVKLSN